MKRETAALAAALTLWAATACAGPALDNATAVSPGATPGVPAAPAAAPPAGPPPGLGGWSVVPLLSHTVTADQGDAEVLERQAVLELEREALVEYYNQKMMTASGTLAGIDEASWTVTIKDGSGEKMTFEFDGKTRFQVMLKPVEPAALKAGSRIVCLYQERDGRLYLGRLMAL